MNKGIARLTIAAGAVFLLVPLSLSAQKSRPPLSPSHLKLLSFTLEESTLADVESRLGSSSPGACSQEADASKMICYVSGGANKTSVTFESGPSGGWSVLDGFKVASSKIGSPCKLQCSRTDAIGSEIQTGGGLRLGLTKAKLLSLLGRPSKISGNRYTFEWSSKRRMSKADIAKFKQPPEEPFWSVDDTVEVVMAQSGVIEFEVHHTVFD